MRQRMSKSKFHMEGSFSHVQTLTRILLQDYKSEQNTSDRSFLMKTYC